VAYALSDKMKFIDFGWTWKSVLQQELNIGCSASFLATAGLLVSISAQSRRSVYTIAVEKTAALPPSKTRKAQLTQRGTRNSGACLKALSSPVLATTFFTLARWRQAARPVSLSLIGLKSQIFPTPSHLAPSLRVTPFEFMKKLYGFLNLSYPSSQWCRLRRFWMIHPCDGRTDRIAMAVAAVDRKNAINRVVESVE